ncbi:c-type cytochrome [Methylibium rhizosphaerae]|uniref:c-type cytochrome n=1 Tax=Methylibium rhizosphaerae TaxID=2570323 RepID=UPI00112D812F|nr:c-type cytochrome [Methylibium rhizosphaerae]
MLPHTFVSRIAAASASVLLAACLPSPQARQASGDAERGRKLIAQYQCGECHSVPGVEDARGTRAVTLESFGLRSYIAGRVPQQPEVLVRWIVEPAAVVPGTTMPRMGVSERDARDIAAYLGGLR